MMQNAKTINIVFQIGDFFLLHTRRTRGESNRSVKRAADLAESAARWWSLLGRLLVLARCALHDGLLAAVACVMPLGHLPATHLLSRAQSALHVLIDDFDYLIRIRKDGDEQWTGIDLDRLLVVAAEAPGDSNGIRVRVQKRVTARASAEQKLRDALAAQGIGSDAVFESSELLEQPLQ